MKTIDTVYCAATTPMNEDFQIDYEGLSSNIEWYIESGLGGILVCGGTGEFVSLTQQERMKIVEHSAKQINGRTGFMVGCSAETTAEAIEYARHAEAFGADGLLVISSYYFKPSEEELYQHFKAIANVVKIPIILYNNYGACGTNLTPGFVQRMSKIENIRYLKEADGDLLQFRAIKDACPDDFHMLVGCDTIAYELFKNGATGWISISANALTKQCQTIFECMKNGQEDKAWEIFKVCLPIYAACESSYKAIQTIKYIMDRLGCCGGMSRPPRLPLTEEEKSKIDNMMRQANLL